MVWHDERVGIWRILASAAHPPCLFGAGRASVYLALKADLEEIEGVDSSDMGV